MITLKLDKRGGINKGDVQAFEHDNLSEVYIIQLYKNGEVYSLKNKTVELIMLERKRKLGDIFDLPIYEATEGKVKLGIVTELTKQDGLYDFQITVKDTTGLIETFPHFQIDIKRDLVDDIAGGIIEDPNFTILSEGLKSLSEYNVYKENALKVPEIEQDIVEINEQLDNIEIKKANQSAFNNLRNQVNNLVLKSGGDSNLEVVQARVSNGFSYKNLDNRLVNFESIINDGIFNIEFFDLVNKFVDSSTNEPSGSTNIRITTLSKYNVSSLNTLYLRFNKLTDKTLTFTGYYFDENEEIIDYTSVKTYREDTDTYSEYTIDVTNVDYIRVLFRFNDNSEINENDIYENVKFYYYTDDRITKLNKQFNEMRYDNLGNEFDSPSELFKDITKIVSYNKNIFDKSSNDNVIGYINGAGGGVDSNTNYKTSYFIKGLKENEKYIITPKIRKFLAYDVNNNPIATTYVDATKENYVFTMNSDWVTIRFTYYASDEDSIMLSQGEEPQAYVEHGYMFGKDLGFNDYQVNEIKTIINDANQKLTNKILFNFGDSIAAGDGNNGVGYAELFAKKYNMVCYDFAVGGATIGETSSNNITTQVTNALSRGITPDYILFEGGTNDISGSGVPIGSLTDNYNINNFDKSTTIGALEWIISTLKSNFPNAKMAFVSVHRMGSRGYSSQIERQGACVDTCKKWSVPIIDVFNRGNLNTFLGEYHKFTNPTESQPNGDRTHPNQLGYDTFYLPLIYETLYFI